MTTTTRAKIDALATAVESVFGLPSGTLHNKSRCRDRCDARLIWVRASIEVCGANVGELEPIASRRHGSIGHAYHRANSLMDTDPVFRTRYHAVISRADSSMRVCHCCGGNGVVEGKV